MNREESNKFQREVGVRQGEGESDPIFVHNIAGQNIKEHKKKIKRNSVIGYNRLTQVKVNNFMYADDLILTLIEK